VAQIYLGADITPTANISSNLGSPARRFDTLHSNTASLTGNLSVGVSATIGNDLSVGGSALVTGRVDVTANISAAGNISTSAATVSVSPITGALIVSGGAGIAGNLNVGGNVQVGGRLIALTVPPGTSNTHVATTAFVANAVGTLGNMAFQNNTAVAISGGTISGAAITSVTITSLLTPLAINSGGTGLSTVGTAGQVLTSTGSAAEWQTAPTIGVGQSWQNLTSSRTLGVTYTNSTGRPIQVVVTTTIQNAIIQSAISTPRVVRITVGGVTVAEAGQMTNAALTTVLPVSAIVPAGNTYSVSSFGTLGTLSLTNWAELR
jgi:hypothetical protein